MDIIDKATEVEQAFRDAALSHRTRAQTTPSRQKYCLDCYEEIPATRRQAHPYAKRCIHCQTRHERKNRLK